ncbi:hypothetical protein L7F22_023037 [Adiantum nelumboides]|nr:hypothetical protein [Adiantum nelumboides]
MVSRSTTCPTYLGLGFEIHHLSNLLGLRFLDPPLVQPTGAQRLEILLLSALEHENILPVELSFESEDGFVHLVTPFCAEGTLSQFVLKSGHIKRGDLYRRPKPLIHDCEAATIVASLSKALGFGHSRGIVHLDIKLDNVLLRQQHTKTSGCSNKPYDAKRGVNQPVQDKKYNKLFEYDIFLADFGIAEILDPQKPCKMTGLAGTPIYMAPEVTHRCFYDERVDIYSLGILLHVLLTGMPLPFMGKSHVLVQDNQAYDLLQGMLAMDPEQRMTLSDVLAHPWILQNKSRSF